MYKIKKGFSNPKLAKEYIKRRTVGRIATYYYKNIYSRREYEIWNTDWDLAIILDACRPDVLESCSDSFSFIPETIDVNRSTASSSQEWMETNFDDKYSCFLENTIYITGNPFSDTIDRSMLSSVEEVWRYAWSEKIGTQPPKPITDQAIRTGQEQNVDRLLLHYMQPHFPSIPVDLDTEIELEKWAEGGGTNEFLRLRSGELSFNTVWNAYKENCRYVLESVETLLNNYDAEKVIITSDHGNAFGEWGFYSHPSNCPIPAVRNVPWVETTAKDKNTYRPTEYEKEESEQVNSRLEALGYL